MSKLIPMIYMLGVLILILPSFLSTNSKMKQFLNNRIGTFLTNGEVEDIVNTYRPTFKKVQYYRSTFNWDTIIDNIHEVVNV